MPTAPRPAGLPSQTLQGVGARVLRRFGGAVHSVIAGGIAFTGRLRRPAAPRPGPAQRDPSSPSRKRAPRPPRPAAPVPPPKPARAGWLARWFGLNRRPSASAARPPFPDSDDTPFSPEAYPGLSPEACAFFNRPAEECDPDTLQLVLAALARHIADSMPPELGIDAEALFSTLWGRLGTVPVEAAPDAAPAEEPAPAPAPAQDAEPDAPPAPPVTQLQPRETTASDDAGTAPIVAHQTTPEAAFPIAPVSRRSRSLLDDSRSFRHCRHSGFRRGFPGRLQFLPPPPRFCYAACAGPP